MAVTLFGVLKALGTDVQVVNNHMSQQCLNHTFLWGHCAVTGGLSVGFWEHPPVAAWSVIPAPRRMRWACWAELASALKAAAGSDICCKSCGSNPAQVILEQKNECQIKTETNIDRLKCQNDFTETGIF